MSHPSIFAFIGPTISAQEARAILPNINLLPPISHGDLIRLSPAPGDMVLIIDGYFFRKPAIRHKEILSIMEQGVTVIGASSMGALRAAELWQYGMQGSGTIFQLYRDDVIQGDDEVAVLHATAEDGFRPLSEAQVNIRFTLQRARQSSIINPGQELILLQCAKALPFDRRSWKTIIKNACSAGLPQIVGETLTHNLASLFHDMKKEDATNLLSQVAIGINRSQSEIADTSTKTFVCTGYLREWQDREQRRTHNDVAVNDQTALAGLLLLHSRSPEFCRNIKLLQAAALRDEQLNGKSEQESSTLIKEFRQHRNLSADNEWRGWLDQHFLTEAELIEFLELLDRCNRTIAASTTEFSVPSWDNRANVLEKIAKEFISNSRFGDLTFVRHNQPTPWLNATEHQNLNHSEKLITILCRTLHLSPGFADRRPHLAAIKLANNFQTLLALAVKAAQCNEYLAERNEKYQLNQIDNEILVDHFCKYWSVPQSDLHLAVADRGFGGKNDFLHYARYYFGLSYFLPTAIGELFSDFRFDSVCSVIADSSRQPK